MTLIQHLQTVRDHRTDPRYPLWVILVLVLMGTMSGALGYRALSDFVDRHQSVLLKTLDLPYNRLPSYSTLRLVMTRMDFRSLTEAFNAWAREHFQLPPGAAVAMDGKCIRASLTDYDEAYQDFVSLVSAFCIQPGVVIGLQSLRNGNESEITTVQTLLSILDLKGVCFTLDALHTQKNN